MQTVMKMKEKKMKEDEKRMKEFNDRQIQILQKQNEMEKERAKKALIARINRERKVANASRVEKQKEAQKEVFRINFDNQMKRINDMKITRDQMRMKTNLKKLKFKKKDL